MKNLFFLLSLLCLHTPVQAAPNLYKIHAGDILNISVWGHENLTRQLSVLPDGSISFPLSGVMMVAGKSLEEIQNELAKKLAVNDIVEPRVNVSVKQIIGNIVYVIGQVEKPGPVVMTHQMDVMQALSVAEGLTPFAQANNIIIIRRKNDLSKAIEFEYGEVEDGDGLDKNHLLEAGDVIVVP